MNEDRDVTEAEEIAAVLAYWQKFGSGWPFGVAIGAEGVDRIAKAIETGVPIDFDELLKDDDTPEDAVI